MQDCEMVTSWVRSDDGDEPMYDFEAQASFTGIDSDSYVAVGFSRDTRMEDDTVCMSSAQYSPATLLYWNIHDNTMPVEDPAQGDNGVENTNVNFFSFHF